MSKRVLESFAFSNKDDSITVVEVDSVYDDDHPYVKAYPSRFETHNVDPIAAPKAVKTAKVEKATAEPGETRDVERPAQKFGTVTPPKK